MNQTANLATLSALKEKLINAKGRTLESLGTYQDFCRSVVEANIFQGAGDIVSLLYKSEEHSETVFSLMQRTSYLDAVLNEGWEIRLAKDDDYYAFKLEASTIVNSPSTSEVDIDWQKYILSLHPNRTFLLDTREKIVGELIADAYGDKPTKAQSDAGLNGLLNALNANTSDAQFLRARMHDCQLVLHGTDDEITSIETADLLSILSEQLGVTEDLILKQVKPFVAQRDYGDLQANSAEDAAREFAELEGIEPCQINVCEHWIVSDWLAEKLQERGEIVGELVGFTVWGRTFSGQSISIDWVTQNIVQAEYTRECIEMINAVIEPVKEPSPDDPDYLMHSIVLDALENKAIFKDRTGLLLMLPDVIKKIIPSADQHLVWALYNDATFRKSHLSPKWPIEYPESDRSIPLKVADVNAIVDNLYAAHWLMKKANPSYTPPDNLAQRLGEISPLFASEHAEEIALEKSKSSANVADDPAP